MDSSAEKLYRQGKRLDIPLRRDKDVPRDTFSSSGRPLGVMRLSLSELTRGVRALLKLLTKRQKGRETWTEEGDGGQRAGREKRVNSGRDFIPGATRFEQYVSSDACRQIPFKRNLPRNEFRAIPF